MERYYSSGIELVLRKSRQLAAQAGSSTLELQHILLALLLQESLPLTKALRACAIDPIMLQETLTEGVGNAGQSNAAEEAVVELVNEKALTTALLKASNLTEKMKLGRIDVEHLIWAIFSVEQNVERLLKKVHEISRAMPITDNDILRYKDYFISVCEEHLSSKLKVPTLLTPTLDYWAVNITEVAGKEGYEYAMCREPEISSIIQVLLKRRARNAILVGSAGVGRRSVINALAKNLVAYDKQIPMAIHNKTIIKLNLADIAGECLEIGRFYDRMKQILKELRSISKHTILFIDDLPKIETLASIARTMDIRALLRKELEGGLQIIGYVTAAEFEALESSRALNGLISGVRINSMSETNVHKVLIESKVHFEAWHKVTFSNLIIEEVVKRCFECFPNAVYPQHALDVLDSIGASLSSCNSPLPKAIAQKYMELDDIRRQKNKSVKNQSFEMASAIRVKELVTLGQIKMMETEAEDANTQIVVPVTEDDVNQYFNNANNNNSISNPQN
jgi:ATP-dependent Clp protease ATP-binding subunit ClpA